MVNKKSRNLNTAYHPLGQMSPLLTSNISLFTMNKSKPPQNTNNKTNVPNPYGNKMTLCYIATNSAPLYPIM